MSVSRLIKRFAFGAALLFSLPAVAGELQVGPYTIRYNALPASALPEASAVRYGIPHSARQGLVNISVVRQHAAGGEAVDARVHGRALTLTGVPIPISFRSVEDGGVTSWLGSFVIPGNETLRFEIDVTPKGKTTTRVEFVQDFIVE